MKWHLLDTFIFDYYAYALFTHCEVSQSRNSSLKFFFFLINVMLGVENYIMTLVYGTITIFLEILEVSNIIFFKEKRSNRHQTT